MEYQNVFQRYEMKYLVTEDQREVILSQMAPYIQEDIYGKSTVCNVYYDTPQYLLIRRSLERPVYKEKLRVRSYGKATKESPVFLELKKKYQSVVYKRRVSVKETEALGYLRGNRPLPFQNQITEEIDYFRAVYRDLAPKVYVSYRREAFCAKNDENLRITFDDHIVWRKDDLNLCGDSHGELLMQPGQALMEIKTAGAIPLWLTKRLSEHRLYKTTFSKYGTVYLAMQQRLDGDLKSTRHSLPGQPHRSARQENQRVGGEKYA